MSPLLDDSSAVAFRLYRLVRLLLRCNTVDEVYRNTAEYLAKSTQAEAIVWQLAAAEGQLVPVQKVLSDKAIKVRAISLGADFLGDVFRDGSARTFPADSKTIKHLQLPGQAGTIACIPFKGKPEVEGVVEVIRVDGQPFAPDDVDFLSQAVEAMAEAAAPLRIRENQARGQLNAITRLTLLYDISQVFNSTLELSELLPIITGKIKEIMDADTCNIWLTDETGENANCAYTTGTFAEMFADQQLPLEGDIVSAAINTEGGVLLENAAGEEALTGRFENPEEAGIATYVATRLMTGEEVLGAVELINRTREEPYSEEDLFLLNDLAKQASTSIHNANLLDAERKVAELDALLEISKQITATLDLNRVLLTIVNESARLIPYERASIGLIERNKLRVAAVSGKMEVDQNSQETRELAEMLTWAAGLEKGVYVSEFKEKIIADREETRLKFEAYFAKTGYKAFAAVPLKDDEGKLGMMAFESTQPYFLDERHLEITEILANQATVAMRNAQLYRQVPLINVLEPIMQRKAKIMKMPQSRKIAWAVGLVCALLVLIAVPWNMKIDGDATVLPALRTPVLAQVDGIVRQVNYREGSFVKKGSVLAELEDREYQLALNNSKTKRDVLQKQIAASDSAGDSAASRLYRIQAQQAEREIAFYQEQANRTRLIAPIDAVIVTPRLEEKRGQYIRKGEEFCELADMRTPRAEIFIDQSDTAYVKPGQKVRLKMNSFPTRVFFGNVTLLGAEMTASPTDPRLRLEAQVANRDSLIKAGMVGKAKIETGWRSSGYVLFRKPVRFFWKKFWSWLP